jgi:hypothetical protein
VSNAASTAASSSSGATTGCERARRHAALEAAVGQPDPAGAHQKTIGMSVIATSNFRIRVPPSRHERRAGRHHRFRAGRHESQPLCPRNAREDPFRERKRVRLARAQGPAVVDRGPDGLSHDRIAVAQYERAKTEAKINVGEAETSVSFAPAPETKKTGVPPTPWNARTGLWTPPGAVPSARS